LRRLAAVDCSATPDGYRHNLIFLNLNIRPNINGTIDQSGDSLLDTSDPPGFGWNGNEYDLFLLLQMYIGGKNNDDASLVGRAYVGYDCSTSRLCVAAYLDNEDLFKTATPGRNCTIVKSSDSTWVSYDNGVDQGVKYKEADAFAFKYVEFPDLSFPGDKRPIGR
jgi:hypothetical protein